MSDADGSDESDSCGTELDSLSGSNLQKYALVRFIHRGRKKKVESIDIVPTKRLDLNQKRMITKFMPGPYNSEDLKILHYLVKKDVHAPADWPTFPVVVLGRATTYNEALNKLKRLEKEESVLTAESDDSFSEQQNKIQSAVKKMKLKEQAESLKKTFCRRKKAGSQEKSEETFVEPSTSGTSKRKIQKDVPDHDQACTSADTTVMLKPVQESEDNSINTATTQNAVDEPGTDNPIERSRTPTAADEPEVENSAGTTTEEVQTDNPATPVYDEYLLDDQLNIQPSISLMELNLPVLGGKLYESKSDFEAVVLNKLAEMTTQLNNLTTKIENLTEKQNELFVYIMDKKIVPNKDSVIDYKKKYNLSIPLKNIETFTTFDEEISTNNCLKTDLYLDMT